MTGLAIRNWTRHDGPGIVAIQSAYTAANPDAVVMPAEVYLHPAFAGGDNILCAQDADGELVGYAPLLPQPASGRPEAPHRIWSTIKVDPGAAGWREIRDALYDRMLARAREIRIAFAPGETCLCFEYASSETDSIGYALERGFHHKASAYRMARDLSLDIPEVPLAEGVSIRQWRMEADEDQHRYIEAKNLAFPGAPETVAGLQHFMTSDLWAVGTAYAAWAGGELVGSVMAFWDEKENRALTGGAGFGFTENVFVVPEWRGRGIASCLLAKGLAYLRQHGLREARLEVLAANAGALRVYTNLGFRVTGEEVELHLAI